MKPTSSLQPMRLSSAGLLILLAVSCCEDQPLKEAVQVYGYGFPNCLAVSPDGRSFITGGPSRAVLRDIDSGRVQRVFDVGWKWRKRPMQDGPFPDHVSSVAALAFSADGTRLLTMDSSATAQLWEVTSGQAIGEPNHCPEVTRPGAVALAPAGGRVARTLPEGTVRVSDLTSGLVVANLATHTNGTPQLAFATDGHRLLTGSSDDMLARLWDVDRRQVLATFAVGERVLAVAFAPGETEVVVASQHWEDAERQWSGRVRWFDVLTGEESHALSGNPVGVTSIASTLDGRRLVTGHGEEHVARVWEVASGELVRTLEHRGYVQSATFLPDGSRVLTQTGAEDPGVWLWDLSTEAAGRRFEGYAREITSVAFAPAGDQVLTAARQPDALWLWDATTGELVRSFDPGGDVRSVAFLPDGKRLLAGGSTPNPSGGDPKGRVGLWAVDSGECLQVLETDLPVNAVVLSAQGDQVLIGCGWGNAWDGYAQLRLIESGDILQTFTNEWILGVTSVALSADETQVLTGHGYGMGEWGWGEANLWDVASGSLVLTLMDVDNSRVNSVGFSHDGARLLVMGRSLESFDRTTGERIRTLELRDAPEVSWPESYAAVSTDGTEVLFATTYRFMGEVVFQCANLVDPDTGYLVCGLPWGGPPAVFSPDERLVLTGGASGVAALWDIRNAASLLQIRSAESGPEVTWKKGALQYAPTPEGAWQDLPAASPMPISPIGEQGFFRVRIEDDPGN